MKSEELLINTVATATALLLTLYGPVPPDTVVRRSLPLATDAVEPESTPKTINYIAGTLKLLVDTKPKGEVTFTVIAVPPGQGRPKPPT